MAEIDVPHFVARPAAAAPGPGVLVIHEGNGMSPQLLRVCQRLAHEGYPVVAPDLFWRFGGSDPAAYAEHLRSIRHDDVLADLAASIVALRALGATSVGVTGFCMGGLFTYLAATRGLDVQCAVPFYGGLAAHLGEPSCPTLVFFGGRDEYIPTADIEAVQAHHGADVVVYPDAGHGFMRDGSDSYDEPAALDAWARTLAFFAAHLH